MPFAGGGGGQGDGALHRYPAACPSQETLDLAGPSAVYMESQARAFGMGLAIRCAGQPEEAVGRCRWLSAELVEACLTGLAEAPR